LGFLLMLAFVVLIVVGVVFILFRGGDETEKTTTTTVAEREVDEGGQKVSRLSEQEEKILAEKQKKIEGQAQIIREAENADDCDRSKGGVYTDICYFKLAYETKDKSYCEKVESEKDKEKCLAL